MVSSAHPLPPQHPHQLFHHRPPPSTPNICFLVLTCLAHLFFLALHPHTAQSTSSWLYTFFFLFISSLCSAWYLCHNSLTFSGQCGYWKGVKGGVGQGQCGYWKGSMEALVRSGSISMGVGQGQWGYWTMGAQWGHWKKTMKRALVGQWGYWKGVKGGHGEGSGQTGLGFGSDRGVAVGQTGVWPRVRQEVVLQGCKLHLAGL